MQRLPSLRYARETSAGDERIDRARELACEIEELLTTAATERASEMDANAPNNEYAVRLAQAMARSLIDQLAEIDVAPSTTRPIAVPRHRF